MKRSRTVVTQLVALGSGCAAPLHLASRRFYTKRSSSHARDRHSRSAPRHIDAENGALSASHTAAAAAAAGLSVRSAERLLSVAQAHLAALLSTTPSSSAVAEVELAAAMDALATLQPSHPPSQERPARTGSASGHRGSSSGVVWTAAPVAASGPAPTLADWQPAATRAKPITHDPQFEAERALPPTFAEKRASLLYATVLHWVVVAADRVPAHSLVSYQDQLLSLLVPPSPPPSIASTALARSLWRRGAAAYVACLVRSARSPSSAAEWYRLRSVLVAGTSDGSGMVRRITSAPRETSAIADASRSRSQGHQKKRKNKNGSREQRTFRLVTLPFLPSGESWCRRGQSEALFASQRDWTDWQTLYAILTWCLRWEATTTTTASSGVHADIKHDHGDGSDGDGDDLHVASVDVLAIITACVQQGETREGPMSAELHHVVRRLTALWESARATEQAYPALAAACGVDKTAHQRLIIRGHRVMMTSGVEGDDSASVDVDHRNEENDDGDDDNEEEEERSRSAPHDLALGDAMDDTDTDLAASSLIPFASTTGLYSGWAAAGQWSAILSDIAAQATRLWGTNKPMVRLQTRVRMATESKETEEEENDKEAVVPDAMASHLWRSNPALALFQLWPPLRVATVLKAHAVPRLPDALARAAVTASERALLLAPPTPGLDVLPRRPIAGMGDAAERQAVVDALGADGLAHGRRADSPSLLAIDQRRRLWCIAKARLPPQIARTVVCFSRSPSISGVLSEFIFSPSSTSRGHRPQRRGSSRVFPFVWRVPAKEWLPWYLVASIGCLLATTRSSGCAVDTSALREAVSALQAAVAPTLFRPLADYASFNEHCVDVFVQLARLQPSGGHTGGNGGDGGVEPGTGLWADTAWWLFRPPLCDGDAAVAALWRESQTAGPTKPETVSSPSAPTSGAAPTYADVVLDDAVLRLLLAKVSQLRNYHVAIALETLSRVPGASLAQLLSAMKEDHQLMGPVVLTPESAVAVTTALLLFMLPVMSRRTINNNKHNNDDENASESALSTAARLLEAHNSRYLYFAVPTQKVFHVSTYFKAIHDTSFITRCVGSTYTPHVAVHGWDGAEALLLGRSLRLVDRFPTTTTAPFFHIRDAHGDATPPRCELDVPTLSFEIYRVDVLKALEHSLTQQHVQQASAESLLRRHASDSAGKKTIGMPQVVAAGLPYGLVAVNKPPGMNCTLHAAYPSLIPFLATHVPWDSTTQGAREDLGSALLNSTVPALHQHGLVNRIDVGTSGLVLVVDNHASLQAAVDATLTSHRFRKTYRALVQYVPPPPSHWAALSNWFLPARGVITGAVYAQGIPNPDAYLALHIRQHLHTHAEAPNGRLSTALLDRRHALTRYRVHEYFPRHGVYYVEVELESGRRHQIRQHFASLGFPLVGDTRYHAQAAKRGARAAWGLDRPALHAAALRLVGPRAVNGEDVVAVVECGLPDDMAAVLAQLRSAP